MTKNKTALISGGSGGIGLAIAQKFAAEGISVLLIARNKKALADAKKKIPGAVTYAMDVTSEKAVKSLFKKIKQIDILVNAAGVIEPIAPIEKVDAKKWLKLLEINVFGTFLMTKYSIPLLKKSDKGTIVNFVGGGEGAFPNFSAYATSKGAVARFTETAAAELKDKNISVFAIAPGAVNTKMTEDMLKAGAKAGPQYEKAKKQKQDLHATAERATKLVYWLATNNASAVSGRLLSAQWDNFEAFTTRSSDIASSDVYTMRRVQPKDRGFLWE